MTTKRNIVGDGRLTVMTWQCGAGRRVASGIFQTFGSGTQARNKAVKTTIESTSMKNLIPLLAAAAVALSLSSTRAADVKELYEKSCVKCHGADGKGETKMGKKVGVKDLTDAKVQGEFTDEQAFKTIKDGKKDKDDKVLMKPIEGATDDEIKALVAHVRSLKK